MSRTYRRKKGDRHWANPDVPYERTDGFQYRNVCVNREEIYLWNSWTKPKPEPVYKVRLVPVTIRIQSGRKVVDVEYVRFMEMDHGNWTNSRIYKWYVNKSDRAKRRNQLHKVKESCYDSFDDIYEYDESSELAAQRNLVWAVYW